MSSVHIYVGIAMALCGAVWLTANRRFVGRALRARGRVVDHEEKRDSDGSTFASVFTFADAAGEEHTVTSSWSSNPKAHRIGAPVEVIYLPEQPEKAQIYSLTTLYLLPAILSATGVVVAIWG